MGTEYSSLRVVAQPMVDFVFGLAHVLERRQTNNEDRGGTAHVQFPNMSIDTAKCRSVLIVAVAMEAPRRRRVQRFRAYQDLSPAGFGTVARTDPASYPRSLRGRMR